MIEWDEVEENDSYKNLLLGNGFSINISDRFNYKNLLSEAVRLTEAGEISIYPDTFKIFKELDTTNFEEVLKIYHHAYIVHNYNKPAIETAYKKLQEGLFSTIRKRHVPKENTPLIKIYDRIKLYRHLFTTNYDLIPYWSFFENRIGDMKDFFWGGGERVSFDKNSTEVYGGNETLVYYLHGALHLEVNEAGRVQKREIARTLEDEIDKLKSSFSATSGKYPLFITEGKSDQKMRKIRSNDYLSFCYEQLKKIRGNLIIYGHSLSEEYDKHIVDAINQNSELKKIAIGIYPFQSGLEIDEIEASMRRRFELKEVVFFNSISHPLNVNI
ncbi:TPA: DUF4917 family protein [Klebsiella pneumoniae]|nr:DUF4917 family protein [Klebsiella pneumoniae]HBX5730771.1 DUF4917 family protein [Klebsiella pneumoniae]